MTTLNEDTGFRVSRVSRDDPNLSQRKLFLELDASWSETSFILRPPLDKSAIKTRKFRTNKRTFSYAYRRTPSGLAEKTALTALFIARKQKDYEALKAEIEAVSRELEQADPMASIEYS